MAHAVEYNFSLEQTVRCRAKPGTGFGNAEGEYFGFIYINKKQWALILWDDEESPELCEAKFIEIEQKQWISVQSL